MVPSIQVGVSDTLIRAKVPIKVQAFLLSAFLCCEESAPTGTALVWLGIVQSVDKVWSEDLQGSRGDWRRFCRDWLSGLECRRPSL